MPNFTTNHAITYTTTTTITTTTTTTTTNTNTTTTTTTTSTIEHECKLQMVSDWLKKKRNQREPIILELFWQQNSVRK